MIKTCNVITGLSAVFLSLVITNTSAQAATITIANSGFEEPNLVGVAPVIGNEKFTFDTPPGWQLYDPSGLIPANTNLTTSYPGVWNPSSDFYPQEVPEGDNIGAIFLNQTPGSGVVGLSQILTDTLEANTEYTLQVAVGNPGSPFFAGFPGYKVELLAGNSIIAEDNNTLDITEGSFGLSTITYRTSTDDSNLGEPLQIRLLHTLESNGLEVNFDDVQLFTNDLTLSTDDVTLSTDDVSVLESDSILSLVILGIGLIFIPFKLNRI